MRVHIFIMVDNELILNKPEILLHPEFADVWGDPRNVNKDDPSGVKKGWAYNVFRYIYLSLDYRCDYSNEPDQIREKYARNDSGLSETAFYEPVVIRAKEKYKSFDTRIMKLLNSSHMLVDSLRVYFEKANFTDVDDHGKLKYSPKEAMSNIAKLGEAVSGIKDLEFQVGKELEKENAIRGDSDPGLFDQQPK